MNKFDLSKVIFYMSLAGLVVGSSFGYGYYSAVQKNSIYLFIKNKQKQINAAFTEAKEEATTVTKIFPKHFVQPIRYSGEGVTVNTHNENQDYILLSGFFENSNELRLIKRDGSIVARWPVKFNDYFEDGSHLLKRKRPATEWNMDTHGALMTQTGSVVFNFEHGGLVKLDNCGALEWVLLEETHHSVEHAEDGGFWVPGRRENLQTTPYEFPPFRPPYDEDLILKVSSTGEVQTRISVPELFFNSELETLLTSNGTDFRDLKVWDKEIIHLNSISELQTDFAANFLQFNPGDILLSLRTYNMLLVVDPELKIIKWYKVGPWVRQHDPEFTNRGTISVFNNNSYRGGIPASGDLSKPERSNIIEINPMTLESKIVYGDSPGQKFFTQIRGKHQITNSGNLFITEFEGGRVFEVNSTGKVTWEFINRYDNDHAAEITEARVYSQTYFENVDWSCNSS